MEMENEVQCVTVETLEESSRFIAAQRKLARMRRRSEYDDDVSLTVLIDPFPSKPVPGLVQCFVSNWFQTDKSLLVMK